MDEELEWKPNCPICQALDVDESILAQGKEIWVEKQCNQCGVEWLDFYKYNGMDIIDPVDSIDPM